MSKQKRKNQLVVRCIVINKNKDEDVESSLQYGGEALLNAWVAAVGQVLIAHNDNEEIRDVEADD